MSVEIKLCHEQRLQRAVEAAMDGGRVRFRVNPGEPKTVVWVDERTPGTQHTVMSVWGQERYALRAVEEKFQEMMQCKTQ